MCSNNETCTQKPWACMSVLKNNKGCESESTSRVHLVKT